MNNLIKKIVIFLIRRKLGLKKYERFQFSNQASKANMYYFTSTNLMKIEIRKGVHHMSSNCSLNWLLDDHCKIEKEEKLNWC